MKTLTFLLLLTRFHKPSSQGPTPRWPSLALVGGHTMRAFLAVLLLSASTVGVHAQQGQTTFVFVKIMDPVSPLERGTKYEDPLQASLQAAGVGEVTGGGTMMNADKTIAWVGIDVELSDLQRGIPLLIARLRELGAPPGSVLEYKVSGKTVGRPVR